MSKYRTCPECEFRTSKFKHDCSICGYLVGTNGPVKVAPSISAARMARKLAEAQAAAWPPACESCGRNDQWIPGNDPGSFICPCRTGATIPNPPPRAIEPEATFTILRLITAADIEIILNHLRIRHRETLSRQDYAELDALIKRLEA